MTHILTGITPTSQRDWKLQSSLGLDRRSTCLWTSYCCSSSRLPIASTTYFHLFVVSLLSCVASQKNLECVLEILPLVLEKRMDQQIQCTWRSLPIQCHCNLIFVVGLNLRSICAFYFSSKIPNPYLCNLYVGPSCFLSLEDHSRDDGVP